MFDKVCIINAAQIHEGNPCFHFKVMDNLEKNYAVFPSVCRYLPAEKCFVTLTAVCRNLTLESSHSCPPSVSSFGVAAKPKDPTILSQYP